MNIQGMRGMTALAALGLLWGCGGNPGGEGAMRTETHEETLEVAGHEVVCTGLGDHFCLVTRQVGAGAWNYQHESITGFQFERGRMATLLVRVTTNAGTGAQDASSQSYQLLAVKASTELPRTTQYQVGLSNGNAALRKGSNGTWSLLGQLPIACQPATCEALEGLAASPSGAVLTFDHRNSPNGALNLVAAAKSS